jgi:hypothetical protein
MRPTPLLALAGRTVGFASLGMMLSVHAASWVTTEAGESSFPLVAGGHAAPIGRGDDFKVVEIASKDLQADIARVTGARPELTIGSVERGGPIVLVGTLGRNPMIDQLVKSGRLDVRDLAGSWESFVITTIANPFPAVPQALVIVGSDRRGTAYGAYELSQAIGVSPWHWWADVTPEKKPALYVAAGTRRFGPPSVKYRGIFLNDEDWGLQPWAAKTFEPETGDIGPKTYAKIFELMLRLKANTVWPAMHACTKPFNFYPQNKQVADDYAIVMGSSHAEPMLRNNVGEWKEKPELYNYVTNRDGVRAYWEERVKENGKFENIYTLGMRGIHDSGIQGARTDADRIRVLEQTFVDQRAMLAQHVRPDVERVPQMFCAYKEVLGLYRQGLKVPDDVTIVWPDDNHGYVRNFATDEERKRAGGFGVYYHLSYLGAPLSYLWLYTTPPALVWEEMTKAYDHGARTIWIANVGDLKPAEIGTEFFLQLAWDIKRWPREKLPEFLPEWAAREFGAEQAREIGGIMAEYYRLNHQRRPEHLQWWLPKETPRPSPLNAAEVAARLTDFTALRQRTETVKRRLSAPQLDAFFELVEYPVVGSARANQRYFAGEQAARVAADEPERMRQLASARQADVVLRANTAEFNERVAGGKWRGMIYLEPADDQWKSMRIAKWEMPNFPITPLAPTRDTPAAQIVAIEAEHFDRRIDAGGAGWAVIPGLGRSGDSVAIFPTTTAAAPPARIQADAPRLEYRRNFPAPGRFTMTIYLEPTQPIRAGRGLRFALGLDGQPPQEVIVDVRDGSAEWTQGVLNAAITGTADVQVSAAGVHTVQLYGVDAGVVIDKMVFAIGPLPPSYLGPPETKAAP